MIMSALQAGLALAQPLSLRLDGKAPTEAAALDELVVLCPAGDSDEAEGLADDLGALVNTQQGMLAARVRDIVEQLQELKSLRGKNKSVIAHMMKRVEVEKKELRL